MQLVTGPYSTGLAFALAFSLPGRAEEPSSLGAATVSPRSDVTPRIVHVLVAGTPEEVERLSPLLAELLGRLGLAVVVERETSADSARATTRHDLARVSVDLNQAGRASCTIVDARGRVRMARREVLGAASRAILLDEVAHLVQASIESLLAERDETEGTPPTAAFPTTDPESFATAQASLPSAPVASKPLPTQSSDAPKATLVIAPTPAEQRQRAWGLDLGALLGLHGVADTAPLVFGAAAVAHVAYRRSALHLGGWLSGEYRLPFDVQRLDWPPTARTVALRALPSVDFYHRRPWSLGIALGAGLDIFLVEHGFEKADQTLPRVSATQVVPVLAGFGVVRLRLAQNVHLTSLAGLELDLYHRDLEISPGRSRTTRLWPVRPALMLGLTFTPLGAEPFE